MNIPLPAKIRVRVCPSLRFDRAGREAARDFRYVDQCYHLVVEQMQEHLNQLITDS